MLRMTNSAGLSGANPTMMRTILAALSAAMVVSRPHMVSERCRAQKLLKGQTNPASTDSRFEILGQGFEIREKFRVLMVFGDIADESAPDNNAVRK